MLSSQEVDQIRAGDWEVDCSDIIVSNRTGSGPYTGPGSIRQTHTGRLAFKLYGKACGPKLFAFGAGASGQIIPDTEYYDLQAVDTGGRVWNSEHILAHEHGAAICDATILTGELPRLLHSFEFRGSAPNRIVLRFFEDLEIPLNSGTVAQTSVAGMEATQSFNLNASRFAACGTDFLLTREDQGLLVSIMTGPTPIAAHMETRIVEALQFVLARPLFWTLLERYSGRNGAVEIRWLPERGIRPPRAEPPISFRHVLLPDEVWRLCGLYLAHVLPYQPPEGAVWYHPLSELVHSVLEASRASVDAEALELGVAIEGVLRREFPELGAPTPQFLEEIEAARVLTAQSALSCDAKKRIDSALRAMKDPRAKDKLWDLVNVGALTGDQLKAWDRLRNPSSHGVRAHERELQDVVDLCGQVLVLFYHLIFWRIGYRGHYTDYGTNGWPTRQYQPRASPNAVEPGAVTVNH